MPPVSVLEEVEKIEAELTSSNAMLKKLTEAKQRKERRRFGIVTVRGLEHIFVPMGDDGQDRQRERGQGTNTHEISKHI